MWRAFIAAGARLTTSEFITFYSNHQQRATNPHSVTAAQKVLGVENVNDACDPLTISEDFSSMLRVKPGC
ncbi:hypothetical protein O9992_23560 [Vibrio lentus]|nr:hypothetical protein [Vibrio lentus]